MSSQSEIVVTVKAGQTEMPVRAGGDFIFVKEAARNVRVIVDGQAINMGRGDKRRIERSDPAKIAFDSFEISNSSDVDLRIVLVVGEGDYESQIVTGELSISEFIKTTSASSNSLPVTIKKTFGFVEAMTNGVTNFQSTGNSKTLDTGVEGYAYGSFVFDDRLFLLTSVNLYEFDWLGNEISSTPIVNNAFTFSSVSDETIYGACVLDNVVYVSTVCRLCTFDMGTYELNQLVQVTTKNPLGPHQDRLGRGIVADVANNRIVISGGQRASYPYDKFVWVYDVDNGAQKLSCSYNGNLVWDDVREKILVAPNGGNTYSIVSDDLSTTVGTVWKESVTHGPCIENKKFNAATRLSGSAVITFHYLREKQYTAKLYVQEGSDIGTRSEFVIDVPLVIFDRAGDTVLVGEIVKALLVHVLFDGVPENYLDYVVSIEYTDGKSLFKKSSGTASWAYRGYKDYQKILLESEVVIEVLPELLTDVY